MFHCKLLNYTISLICLQFLFVLNVLEEADAKEILDYVLSKYEEVDMKITGEPLAVRGKRITSGGVEEFHIVFHYVDNTPGDVIQNCVFVVEHRPNACETISTVCNTFLPVTPRPLLQRKDLTVCEDGGEAASARADPPNEQLDTNKSDVK